MPDYIVKAILVAALGAAEVNEELRSQTSKNTRGYMIFHNGITLINQTSFKILPFFNIQHLSFCTAL